MTQEALKKIKEELKTYIEDNPDLNNTKLAEKYLKENAEVPLSVRSIRQYISMVKKAEEDLMEDAESDENANIEVRPIDSIKELFPWVDVNELIKEAEGDSKETVEDKKVKGIDPNIVTIEGTKRSVNINRRKLDELYCSYSRKGLNLASTVVTSILGISSEDFRLIASRLGLSKESEPYSDYSRDILSDEDLYRELNENVEDILNLLQEHDGTIISPLVKQYKKAILRYNIRDLKLASLIENIKEELPKVNIRKLSATIKKENVNHTHLFIPDMHLGMSQKNFNYEIAEQKLVDILDTITHREYVHVHFLGDIIHSFTGLNHKTSWKNMEKDSWGANAIIKPYELLLNFLSSIGDLYSVDIVGGNHDRMSSDRNEENTGEAAKLLAYMLDHSLDSVNVRFDPGIIIDDSDPNMVIITMHGDYPVDKLSGQSIAWEYGNPAKFNYIATAHYHSRKQNPKEDGLRFRKCALPAFCPSDDYAKTVAHASMPGFQVITTTDDKLPIIIDYPLHYD
jgi:hypothetical protein